MIHQEDDFTLYDPSRTAGVQDPSTFVTTLDGEYIEHARRAGAHRDWTEANKFLRQVQDIARRQDELIRAAYQAAKHRAWPCVNDFLKQVTDQNRRNPALICVANEAGKHRDWGWVQNFLRQVKADQDSPN
ncbi:MAG: hypothetical protein LBK54_07255 [Propionibacteriaceae bacterium]|jgi:hypothetical protein|nr:hypothetical protein [Propionibacteriaceae bacterium]